MATGAQVLILLSSAAGQAAAIDGRLPTNCPAYELGARRRAWMAGYVRELVTREAQFLADPALFPVKQLDPAPSYWSWSELLFLELAYRPPGRAYKPIDSRLLVQLLGRRATTIRVRASRGRFSPPKSKPARAA